MFTIKKDSIMTEPETMMINKVEYVRKDSLITQVVDDGLVYCMVRTYSAGVFAGYIQRRNGKDVTLVNARRMRYWEGAMDLSQLAIDGTKKPEKCKFTREVPEVTLTEVIEFIPISKKAAKTIAEVKVCQV